MISRPLRLTAALLCLVSASVACQQSPGSGPSGPGSAKLQVTTPAAKGAVDSLRWNVGTEPPSLDWVYGYDYPPNTVLSNVCESLMRIGPDFSVQPNLAEKVDHPDPLTYVYTVRQNVTFHDGSMMTAEDVAYSLSRHRDAKVGSYWSTAYANVASVKVSGPRQVTVKLSRPDALFNELMAVPPGVVASKASVRKLGKRFGSPDGGLNCTGPFSLKRWSKGQSITLERHDGYWDPARAAKPASVEFVFLKDVTTSVNALVAGEVDGAYGVAAPSYARLRSSGKGALVFGPTTSTVNLVVSDLKGPLADVRLRRALSLALDRKGFAKTAFGGYAEPSRAVASRFTWGKGPARAVFEKAWKSLPPAEQDVAEAKRLVAQAGKPSRPIVVAASNAGSVNPLIGTEVQAAGKRIGLDVEIKAIAPEAYGALFGDAKAREGIDLFHTSWYADIAQPLQVYQNWHSESFANYGGYRDAAYDRLITEALAEPDPLSRAELTARAQRTVSEQLLWIPLVQTPGTLFMNRRITGAPATNAYLYYPWAARIGSSR
ncbi:ABC transporter substrate-binding protein [Streptomyces sp. NPDC091287]|uniref:ABC transporter substrate-binding protein n=1 Tax=Streptomyces sp. NPDC091287 TaxID=3365988 RepID=UPI00381F7F2E